MHLRRELETASHGRSGELVGRAADELGYSVPSVYRLLRDYAGYQSGRKQRSDAGSTRADDAELRVMSGALQATVRQNGKRVLSVRTAAEMLAANGLVSSGLSPARWHALLRQRGMHPQQLARPDPALVQRSLHPNHVWQADASVCIAYYLSNATGGKAGLQVMDEKAFYKNKPANVSRIQDERLIRYTLADHCSHEVLTRYYLGSECAVHLTDFLIWCMAPKEGHPMHGVPFIMQMDMGSANTSAMTLNLLEQLGVRVIVHERHNSRANGSVEQAHNIVEREFESALSFQHVESLADLNAKALIWANHFAATRVHTRLRATRHAVWMRITPEQLRLAPAAELMRDLASAEPVTRRVSNNLTVSFVPRRGQGQQEYDVRFVPGVIAGEKLRLRVNAFRCPAVDVEYVSADGQKAWMAVEPTQMGADGRPLSAPVIGEQLRLAPRGLLEQQRDANTLAAYGASADGDVDAALLAKEKGALAFGGEIDPFRLAAEASLPAFLPRRGTEHSLTARNVVDVPRLNVVEACKRLKTLLGEAYGAQVFSWMQERFGEQGVPEDQLEQLASQWAKPVPAVEPGVQQAQLRIVNGGDA